MKNKKATHRSKGTKRSKAAKQKPESAASPAGAQTSPARVNLFDEPHENAVSLDTLDFKEQILERFHTKMDIVLAILVERLPVSRRVKDRVLAVVGDKVINKFVGDHFANARLRESGWGELMEENIQRGVDVMLRYALWILGPIMDGIARDAVAVRGWTIDLSGDKGEKITKDEMDKVFDRLTGEIRAWADSFAAPYFAKAGITGEVLIQARGEMWAKLDQRYEDSILFRAMDSQVPYTPSYDTRLALSVRFASFWLYGIVAGVIRGAKLPPEIPTGFFDGLDYERLHSRFMEQWAADHDDREHVRRIGRLASTTL
jgi:hypothetical protein